MKLTSARIRQAGELPEQGTNSTTHLGTLTLAWLPACGSPFMSSHVQLPTTAILNDLRIHSLCLGARLPNTRSFSNRGPALCTTTTCTLCVSYSVHALCMVMLTLRWCASEHTIRDAVGWPEALRHAAPRVVLPGHARVFLQERQNRDHKPDRRRPRAHQVRHSQCVPSRLSSTSTSLTRSNARHADWAQHGICSRGVFLDMVKFYTEKHGKLPYDPFTTHPIPLADILACAKEQGTTFRPADILILRVGFMQRYNGALQEERDGLAGKAETLCVYSVFYGMQQLCSLAFVAARVSSRPRI